MGSCLKDHFSHLDLGNVMMSLMIPLASHAAEASVNGITWPYLDNLELRNGLVPLMVPLASSDTDTGTNGII